MRGKYKKHWGRYEEMNSIIYLAHILDPRCKFNYIHSLPSKLHLTADMEKVIKEATYALFDDYKRSNIPETSSPSE